MPTITSFFTTSGATVKVYAALESAAFTSHTKFPVLVSKAIRWASSVAMKSLLPRIAKPRFTMPQHG
jgi:hypothetical protein